jgi:hypothetical protein
MRRNVIIVGPPRSGTSLASDIFARRGYYTGEGLRVGDDYNPFGYYEAEDLIAANVSLLESVEFPHHNTWKFDAITPPQVDSIGRIPIQAEHRALLDHWNRHSPWMWKDPRFAITLGYWGQLVDHDATGVILTNRNPEDVYWSFRRKGWCDSGPDDRKRAIRMIEQHADNARQVVDRLGLPHITVDYNEYHNAPGQVAARISGFTRMIVSASDLNFHTELDHSTGAGRLAGHIRVLLKKLPRGPLRQLSRLVPQRLQSLLIPERRFATSQPDSDEMGRSESKAA